MIEVTSLTRRYGAITAVDRVSFSITENEIVGLLGHNGAGKTTIMRILTGCLEPSAGQVLVDDIDIAADPEAVQQQLGYLPENLPLYPEMMVADYLEYAATMKQIPAGQRMREVQEVLAATDLLSRAVAPIGTLSRGLKQRLGVAQAILGKPQLLILDEPTNGLDPAQTEQMRQLIKRLARRATIILSTHIMQEVEAVCDRVLVLRNGRLALDEPLATLRRADRIRVITDRPAPRLAAELQAISGVERVSCDSDEQPERYFELHLAAEADSSQVAGRVSSSVQAAGAQLIQLAPSHRTLDALFTDDDEDGD